MRYLLTVATVAIGLMLAAPASAQIAPVPFPNEECYGPAGDPEPGSQEWIERDTKNQLCAALRNRDQLGSPAYGYAHNTAFPGLHLEALMDQAQEPTEPRGGITTLVPGSRAADPFRTLKRWTEAGRGYVTPVEFDSQNGSTLRGHVFEPPASLERPDSGFPGVVITDGSVQAYEELYYWAAQDLAANGYVVMTYDVQGQGDSDLWGTDCPGECSGVPYQQSYNFHQGAEDSLEYFLSAANPARPRIDADRIGIAGHSLGASAVSQVGHCDSRVKAIVAWDNLRANSDCEGVSIPEQHLTDGSPRVPSLGISNDYGFWTQPTNSPPDADAKLGGYEATAAAGVDSAEIVLRGATHLEYSYIPVVLPASRLGERIASYYTRAWFDRYLKGEAGAFERLTATEFDDSADATSIGAGDYSTELALADPTDPTAGNVPYEIEGIPVENALSFYYRSAYSLTEPQSNPGRGKGLGLDLAGGPPTGEPVTCEDIRAGCTD